MTLYICISTYLHICIKIYIYIHICIYIYTYMYAFLYLFKYLHMYSCIFVYRNISIYIGLTLAGSLMRWRIYLSSISCARASVWAVFRWFCENLLRHVSVRKWWRRGVDSAPKHLDIFQGASLRLPKPLSDQYPVRVCTCPLCIINRL